MLEPEKLVAAHLGGFLEEQQGGLTKTLKTLEGENEELANKIRSQQGDMETLVRGLEAMVADLQRAAEMVQAPEVRQLSEETRSMHSELQGTGL
jgi:predicted RNase H-like nuclease (RuvC/YqgF family)